MGGEMSSCEGRYKGVLRHLFECERWIEEAMCALVGVTLGKKASARIGEPIVDLSTRESGAVHEHVLLVLRRVRVCLVSEEPAFEVSDGVFRQMSSSSRIRGRQGGGAQVATGRRSRGGRRCVSSGGSGQRQRQSEGGSGGRSDGSQRSQRLRHALLLLMLLLMMVMRSDCCGQLLQLLQLEGVSVLLKLILLMLLLLLLLLLLKRGHNRIRMVEIEGIVVRGGVVRREGRRERGRKRISRGASQRCSCRIWVWLCQQVVMCESMHPWALLVLKLSRRQHVALMRRQRR